MRGKRGSNGRRRYRQASTPAYAGQTHRWPERVRPAGLYPRICGANGSPACTRPRARPLPPHMRGKPSWSAWDRCDACLYPRICGANVVVGEQPGVGRPLPPHMRGKLVCGDVGGCDAASTPAYAGQTSCAPVTWWQVSLYPRICGANAFQGGYAGHTPPLPPHMRGKRSDQGVATMPFASTPAYAGQTLVEPQNSAGAYSPTTRFSFTASPPTSSGTRHTPSKTTGPATTSSKTTVR